MSDLNVYFDLRYQFRMDLAMLESYVRVDADFGVCVKCPLIGGYKMQALEAQVLELVA